MVPDVDSPVNQRWNAGWDENIFVCKENRNNDFIQQFFSPELPSSANMESINLI